MLKVRFFNKDEVDDSELKIAVIVARFEDKWVLSRHKERTTWEIPGGHREEGETIEETARRELYEETGAEIFDLSHVWIYGVERESGITYASLYFARISKFNEIPINSEIAEIGLFEILPFDLTYPDIHGPLFYRTQGWLNLRSAPDELWDVYDEERNKTGRLHRRGEPLAKGDRHLSVLVWVRNVNGEYLITKRAPNKGFPLMWEITGGSALAGDDSLSAAIREVREETGLSVEPRKGRCVKTYIEEDAFVDVWLFESHFVLEDVLLQEGETCDSMLASEEMIRSMINEGSFAPIRYLTEQLDLVSKIKNI